MMVYMDLPELVNYSEDDRHEFTNDDLTGACTLCKYENKNEYDKIHFRPSTGYLNVYDTEQFYGGPEEGGWWYDNHSCILSIPCDRDQAPYLARMLLWTGNYDSHGNIHSTRGGRLITFAFESEEAETATKTRPHYE